MGSQTIIQVMFKKCLKTKQFDMFSIRTVGKSPLVHLYNTLLLYP